MQPAPEPGPRPDGEVLTFLDAQRVACWPPWRKTYGLSLTGSAEIGLWADALWAVLNGMCEQIGQLRQEGLAATTPADPRSVTLNQLAMAFKRTDSGVLGDIFEWSVFKCFSDQDPALMDHLDLALRAAHPNVTLTDPKVLMVAHERGQFATAISMAGQRATVPRPGRGRHPSLAKVLGQATAKNWKGDLLVGDVDGNWIPLTLKYRARDLERIAPDDPELLHAPKIGVTLKPTTGTTGSPTVRRNKHGLVIIDLEARHGALRGFGSIFKLVAEGLDRDFVAPGDLATRHPDDQQLLRFLETRRGNQIKHVLDELEGHLRQPPEERPVSVDLTWQEFDSQTSAAPPPQGGVVAVDAIRRARGWD